MRTETGMDDSRNTPLLSARLLSARLLFEWVAARRCATVVAVSAVFLAGGVLPCAQAQNVTVAPVITTAAGNGINGYSGDGGPASSPALNSPSGVAVDSGGQLSSS